VERIQAGDYEEARQTADFDGATLLRIISRIRGPSAVPSGVYWLAELLVDSTQLAQRKLEAGRQRDLFDMGANLGEYPGGADHILKFRLSLQGTTGIYDLELPAWYIDQIVLT
jgi:hypothetical protein